MTGQGGPGLEVTVEFPYPFEPGVDRDSVS